ncbi:hypothetical protein ACWF9G_02350 [Nocardia sp. NPDC055029]
MGRTLDLDDINHANSHADSIWMLSTSEIECRTEVSSRRITGMDMTITDVPSGSMPLPTASARRPRLDALAELNIHELRRLFREAPATTPADFDRLSGDLVLRGLALPGGALMRRLVARPGFIWTGKSFRRVDAATTFGHNFFNAFGGTRALPFVATVGPSMTDGASAARIDYGDQRVRGTWWSRRLYDEVREIEPGLWLGPGYLRIGGTRITLCWFAVDKTVSFEVVA